MMSMHKLTSFGDTIFTRRNNRRLRAGRSWVKNGDRWQVDHVHRDGAIVAHDPGTQRRVMLPRQYVRDQVELGYALDHPRRPRSDRRHLPRPGHRPRVTRAAVHDAQPRPPPNHTYVEVTGDGDPHARLVPDSITPPTPTERLEAILARSDTPPSARPSSRPSATLARCLVPPSPATTTPWWPPPSGYAEPDFI